MVVLFENVYDCGYELDKIQNLFFRSVVGRDGSYLVTFRIDKLFHVRYSELSQKIGFQSVKIAYIINLKRFKLLI